MRLLVALNPRYRAHELSYIVAQSDAVALIVTDHLGAIDYFETLHEVLPELAHAAPGELDAAKFPRLRHVIVDAEDPYPGCHRLSDVMDAGESDAPLPRVGPDEVFTLLYTSGTTSFPKGAMISHRNCVPHGWNCARAARDHRARPRAERAARARHVGRPQRAAHHVEPRRQPRAHGRVGSGARAPAHRARALHRVERRGLDGDPAARVSGARSLRSLVAAHGRFAATGGAEHGFHEAIRDRIGVPLHYQPYGMTEVNALSLLHDLDEPFDVRITPGIKTPPGIEARIAHPDTAALCKIDEEGELQFRGDLVTRGYYNKPAETAAAFTPDGWFKSGDLGVRDSRDFVIFRGRLKDTLRISHHMVAPSEIEAFLTEHPAVSQAFVVGVPDPRAGEVPVAYVILKDGARLDESELVAFCRGKIAGYKVPRGVRVVKDVPRTHGPHGDKVQRVKLRELARGDFAMTLRFTRRSATCSASSTRSSSPAWAASPVRISRPKCRAPVGSASSAASTSRPRSCASGSGSCASTPTARSA